MLNNAQMRKHWRAAVSALALAALGGCGEFMDPPSLDVPLPASFTQDAPRPADTPAPLAREWWKAANDPALNRLMETIERQNFSIDQSRFRLQAARTDIGGNHYLPTLSLSQSVDLEPVATFQQRTTPGGIPTNARVNSKFGGYHRIGLDAQWEIPLFGSYEAAEEMAKASTDFAAADIDAVRASVYAETVTNYIQLRAAQQRLAVLKQMQASQQHIVDLLKIRIDAGLSDSSEHTKNAQELLRIQSDVAAARSGVEEYRQRLARLQGTTIPDAALDAPARLVSFPTMAFGDTPADVVRNRPDIRKAEQAVILAGDELKLAKNDRYPKLNIAGSLFKFDNLIARPQPQTSPAGSLSEGLVLPLFDWGRLMAAAQAKDAKLAETASAYRETVITAITETAQMHTAYREAIATREAATASLAQANLLVQQATTLHRQGLSNDIALETAQIEKQRATIEQASAISNESIRLADLTKALGGGIAETAGAERAKEEK